LAGLERAVPATKSFTTQLLVLRLLSLLASKVRRSAGETEMREAVRTLLELPAVIDLQLRDWRAAAQSLAERYAGAKTLLYLGRGVHYAIAREGALKLKESSYVHAEGYPAGELKHGPNALVSDDVPLVAIATVDHKNQGSVLRYEKTLALLNDMHRQGARIIAVGNAGDSAVRAVVDDMIEVSPLAEALLPVAEVVPLQLFAYYMALAHGVDVDSPRNLVKAVVRE
jgi:glutamine---fructose-6-phosphate transaminase (isomerizing)